MSENEIVELVRRALIGSLLKYPRDGGMHGCTFVSRIPEPGDTDIVVSGHIDVSELAKVAVETMIEAQIDGQQG